MVCDIRFRYIYLLPRAGVGKMWLLTQFGNLIQLLVHGYKVKNCLGKIASQPLTVSNRFIDIKVGEKTFCITN